MPNMILYKINRNNMLEKIKQFENTFLGFPMIVETLLKAYNFNFDYKDVFENPSILDYLFNYMDNTNDEDIYDQITYLFFDGNIFSRYDIPKLSHCLLQFIQHHKDQPTRNNETSHVKEIHKIVNSLITDKSVKAIMITPSDSNDVWDKAFHINIDGYKQPVTFPFINKDINTGIGIKIKSYNTYEILTIDQFKKLIE